MNRVGAKYPIGKPMPQKGQKAQNKKGKSKDLPKKPKISGQK